MTTDSAASSTTRIHSSRILLAVRLVWGALVLALIAMTVVGSIEFVRYSATSCLCDTVLIGDNGVNVQVYPVPDGPAVGLIFDEDVLVAVDGIRLPEPATRPDALLYTDNQQPGTPIVLTVRTANEPERDVALTRYFSPRHLPRDAYLVLDLLGMSVFAVVAFFIAFNRSDDWMALYTGLALLGFGLSTLTVYSYFDTYHRDLFILVDPTLWIIVGTYPILFPDGRPLRRWTPIFGVIFGMWVLAITIPLIQADEILANIVNLIFITTLIFLLRENYLRRFTALRRQQTKWVILGMALVLFLRITSFLVIPILDNLGYSALADILANPIEVMNRLLVLLLPVTFAVATLRYRLYDIDLVINRSLVYGAVTVGMVVIFGIGFVSSYTLAQSVLGAQNAAVPLAVGTFISAIAFNRLRLATQRFVDRRIYRFNFDLNQLADAQKQPEIKNPGALTGRTIGGYQVLGVLGKGGMGEVYQGHANGKDAALKILPQDLAQQREFVSRFEREADTMRALNHPNIVKLITAGEEDGVHYLALEYIDGTDLSAQIKQNGKLTYDATRDLLRDLAAALDYAHAQGLIHRDIKPSNVMLRGDDPPQAVLMDFGIAKIKDAATRYTGSGAIGTIDYMAPEQIMAAKEVDKYADIYALGVMAYEMLTGEKPFKGSAAQIMFAHLQQPPPDVRDVATDVPKSTAQAIERALEKTPTARYESAGDFVAAL